MFFIIHCDIICFEVSHFYNKENLSQKKETRDQIPCRRASARSRWTRAWPVVWPVVWVGMFGTRQPIIIPIKLVFFIALLPSFVDADYYDNILILRPGSPKWWIEARGRRTKNLRDCTSLNIILERELQDAGAATVTAQWGVELARWVDVYRM